MDKHWTGQFNGSGSLGTIVPFLNFEFELVFRIYSSTEDVLFYGFYVLVCYGKHLENDDYVYVSFYGFFDQRNLFHIYLYGRSFSTIPSAQA